MSDRLLSDRSRKLIVLLEKLNGQLRLDYRENIFKATWRFYVKKPVNHNAWMFFDLLLVYLANPHNYGQSLVMHWLVDGVVLRVKTIDSVKELKLTVDGGAEFSRVRPLVIAPPKIIPDVRIIEDRQIYGLKISSRF